MIFTQKQLFQGTTTVALRAESLYVCTRNAQGVATLETEVPFEEMLPIQLNYQNNTPKVPARGIAFALLYVFMQLVRPALASGTQPFDVEPWAWAFGLGFGLMLLIIYAQRNWWRKAVLRASRLQLIFADHPNDRQALSEFVRQLERRTKTYLRDEYGQVNPLGFIEPQLRRVAWLHELDVLSAREAQALSTRLTGRHGNDTLTSMGQELESPYVN